MKRLHVFGATILFLLAAGLMFHKPLNAQARWRRIEAKYAGLLIERKVIIHPRELLMLMNDASIRLTILDLRDEADFNIFNIRDSKRTTLDALNQFRWETLPENAVIVAVSNSESRATEAWKNLKILHATNVYILEGGINNWIRTFRDSVKNAETEIIEKYTDPEALQFEFNKALGNRHELSKPNIVVLSDDGFVSKVSVKKQARKSGGCG